MIARTALWRAIARAGLLAALLLASPRLEARDSRAYFVDLPDDGRRVEVGMKARIDQIVLPGPELEVVPHDDRSRPIVLRIAATYPHGDAHRYDLEYYGLDPGTYDLADYLQRTDGSAAEGLPAIEVEIVPVLPEDRIEPNALEPSESPSVGGYQTLLIVGAIVWVIGLGALLFWGRRSRVEAESEEQRPVTFADRLRPIVEEAAQGELSRERQAELERLLLNYWRRRLGLQDLPAAEAIRQLREHPDAGELLRQLEDWLHRPEPASGVDIGRLLEPYRRLPAEDSETVMK